MVRRADGIIELDPTEFGRWRVILTLLQIVLTATAAWVGVIRGLDAKLDKVEFTAHVIEANKQDQTTANDLRSLAILDSVRAESQKEQLLRLRDICVAVRAGCR